MKAFIAGVDFLGVMAGFDITGFAGEDVAGLDAAGPVGAGIPPIDFGAGIAAPLAFLDCVAGRDVFAGALLPAVTFVQIAPLPLHCSQLVGGMPRTACCSLPHCLHLKLAIVITCVSRISEDQH